jgi:NADH:ubiquinone oxidoreductase subunit 2 (subunit N)
LTSLAYSSLEEKSGIGNSGDYIKLISQDSSLWYKPNYIDPSLVIFTVGFLFKVGAAPFHF